MGAVHDWSVINPSYKVSFSVGLDQPESQLHLNRAEFLGPLRASWRLVGES
jgi:hypothetical protein